MAFKRQIDSKVRAYIKYHGKHFKRYSKTNTVDVTKLAKKCHISVASVYNILKEPLSKASTPASRKGVGGRKNKLSKRSERALLRKIPIIRKRIPNWTAKQLMAMACVEGVSLRTVQRFLNRNGYHHLKARRKGILSTNDTKLRLAFARQMMKKSPSYWQEEIAFYFDGVGFVHRTRPMEHALACRGKVWRKKGEGLALHCTAKGETAGHGGKQVKFFVAISYNCGVICAENYTELNGPSFAKFITDKFEQIFQRSGKACREWLQDGDPSQNSALAKRAMRNVNANLCSIPPRSPDVNPIETVFAHVKKALTEQVLVNNILTETYDQFSLRVKATLYSTTSTLINNIIDSMGTRLIKVVGKKGGRIEY